MLRLRERGIPPGELLAEARFKPGIVWFRAKAPSHSAAPTPVCCFGFGVNVSPSLQKLPGGNLLMDRILFCATKRCTQHCSVHNATLWQLPAHSKRSVNVVKSRNTDDSGCLSSRPWWRWRRLLLLHPWLQAHSIAVEARTDMLYPSCLTLPYPSPGSLLREGEKPERTVLGKPLKGASGIHCSLLACPQCWEKTGARPRRGSFKPCPASQSTKNVFNLCVCEREREIIPTLFFSFLLASCCCCRL